MKVLALDISTKTGWAVFVDGVLVEHGLVRLPKKIYEYGDYPWNYVQGAYSMGQLLFALTSKEPDVIVVEETNKSRARYSQKALEYIHCLFLYQVKSTNIPIKYVSSSEWRKTLGLVMSKDDKKNNKKLKTAKQFAETTGAKLDKAELGIKGAVTKKHIAIRFVNNTFGFSMKVKDNDICDAICLGLAYLKGAKICDGK
jgi:hypothetical protein